MSNKSTILYIGNILSQHGYTPGVIETLGKQLEETGYTVYYGGTKQKQLARLFEMIWKTIKYSRKVNYVLIDTYSTRAFWFALMVGFFSRCFSVKYIPILHGGDLPARLKKSPKVSRLLFKNSYRNVAVSGYLQRAFMEEGYSSVLIPNNIEVSKYKFKKRAILKPNILWVRSFQKEYNPQMAIDVLSKVIRMYPDATLCMVGPDKDGSMERVRLYAEEMGVGHRLKITGRLLKSQWHLLSEEYDIFINTTNFDNTPVSVIEALALGLPVVSTNVGGLPYLLSHLSDSILVEREDPESMASEIIHLLKDPSLVDEITTNGRLKAESFDWAKVKNRWTNLLSDENIQ